MARDFIKLLTELRAAGVPLRAFVELGLSLLGIVVSLVAIIISAFIIMFQMKRQHRSSLDLQRDRARDELKLRVYEGLAELIKKTGLESAPLFAAIQGLPTSLRLDRDRLPVARNAGKPFSPSPSQLSEWHGRVSQSLLDVIFWMERYELAHVGFRVFRDFLSDASRTRAEAFQKILSDAGAFLPIERLDDSGNWFPPNRIPNELDIEDVRALTGAYMKGEFTVMGYLADISAEAQNALLGGLFDRRVQRRRPMDPKAIVLSSDPEIMSKLEMIADARLREWQSKAQGKSPVP